MTHKDLFIKFMIEYDKANVTSSYPALTEYEVCTFFDKAYNALIAQKVTGNNVRRMPFEGDIKSITDLQGLIKNSNLNFEIVDVNSNQYVASLPSKFLYYVSATCDLLKDDTANIMNNSTADIKMIQTPIQILPHAAYLLFLESAVNKPYNKKAVGCIEGNQIKVAVFDGEYHQSGSITYISKPNTFVKDLRNPLIEDRTYVNLPNGATNLDENLKNMYEFELNDAMANELISLALVYALENVESPRTQSRAQLRGLEA